MSDDTEQELENGGYQTVGTPLTGTPATAAQGQTLATAAQGVGSLFPSIQNLLSNGQLNASQSAYQNAVAALNQSVPSQLSNLIPTLALQVVQGTMTPAQAQAAIQQQSAVSGVTVDPSLMNAQMQSLTQLQQVASNGGLTPADKAQLNDINNQVNAQNAGRIGAINQQAQMQGVGGSGLTIANKLSSAQAANNAASTAGANVASNAQARALQAINESGQLGGQIQNEQFGEAAQKAAATDAVNQFNTGLQQQTNSTNAANTQAANAANFTTANQVAANNTAIKNQQALEPLQTAEVQNQQDLNYGANAAKIDQQQGQQLNTQAQKNTQANNGVVSGLIQDAPKIADAATSIFGSFSDEKMKTDKSKLSDSDIDDLLNKLSGNKYKYKSDSPAADGGKTHYGVMAQDMEKTPLKNSVVDTDKGKFVTDNDDKQNAILAALSQIHERVEKMEGAR